MRSSLFLLPLCLVFLGLFSGCTKDETPEEGPRTELRAGEAFDPDITFTDISNSPFAVQANNSFAPDSNWTTTVSDDIDVDGDGPADFRFEAVVTNLAGQGVTYSHIGVESLNGMEILSLQSINFPIRMASGETLAESIELAWAPEGTFGFMFVDTGDPENFPGDFTGDGFLGFRHPAKKLMGWLQIDISQFSLEVEKYATAPVEF